MQWLTYLAQWYDGLISESELHAKLADFHIHGGVETSDIKTRRCGFKFVGFDYHNQQWLTVEVA